MGEEERSACARCGRRFWPGETRYVVKIRMAADFDGVLGERGVEGENYEVLWEAVEERSEEELMAEVVEEISFRLCPRCRREWRRAPWAAGKAEEEERRH